MRGTTSLRRTALAAALLGVLAWTAPARADVIAFTMDPIGWITPKGDVTVSGTITCTPEERFHVSVKEVRQKGYVTWGGMAKDACSGGVQLWEVTTNKDDGGSPIPGEARLRMRWRTFSPGALNDEALVETWITLIPE
jgi:hypothetical protein